MDLEVTDVLFFLHIRENYILHQQKHAFNQPRCMYFSALPRTTPCVLDFLVFCYVDEGSAMYCYHLTPSLLEKPTTPTPQQNNLKRDFDYVKSFGVNCLCQQSQ